MTRKELSVLYNVGEKKIRELVRQAGINHRKQLLPVEVEKFIQLVGKPIKHSDFERYNFTAKGN
jgi:hypothetical protein